jgi:hypothetical protein
MLQDVNRSRRVPRISTPFPDRNDFFYRSRISISGKTYRRDALQYPRN